MSEHSVSVVMQSVSRYWYLYSAAMLGLRQSSKPSDGYLAKMTRSCVSSTASTFELAFKLCCLLVFECTIQVSGPEWPASSSLCTASTRLIAHRGRLVRYMH